MDNNAPKVWERADKIQFEALQPLYLGGVWNYDWWTKLNLGYCNAPCNPLPPTNSSLCGYQNTVTNGLYLVLATRLYEATRNPIYRDAAIREYTFLYQWFILNDNSSALLNRYTIGKVVVRERVGVYANNQSVQNYRPDLAWAGDQGLILSGLVDMMHILGSGSPSYDEQLGIAKEITAGVKDYLVDNQGYLLPWKPNMAPGNDNNDYNTGIGIYMRYLLYTFHKSADMRTYLQEIGYSDFVRVNAERVLQNPSPPSDMVGLTNDLATLVVATVMLG